MKSLILLGLVVTLSSVFCKEHQIHTRQNVPQRKYKDTKSKRGIGDYPLNLSFGAPSIGSFQPAGHVSGPFSSGLPNFGSYGYGGGNLLSQQYSSPIGLQSSPSYSVVGSPSLSGLNYGGLSQHLNLNHQSTDYAASAPTLNLASLLGGQASQGSYGSPIQGSYGSPTIGLFSPEKTGPVTFTSQAVEQPRQQYTPVYATAHPVGSSRIATPLMLTSSPSGGYQLGSSSSSGYQLASSPSGGYQLGSSSSGGYQLGSPLSGGYQLGASLQRHSLSPTTLRSLGSIGSLTGNGVSYAIPATLSRDSSHTVSGGYIIASANPVQSGSSPTYTVSGPPSSSDYTISVPSSSSSSSSPNYQLSAAASTYSASPSNSFSANYAKYNPSSDASTYSGSPLKLSSSVSGNYASVPNYSNSASTSYSAPSDSSAPSRHNPVTSYGTPATSYSIPSTSYGVPSSSQYVSNLNYNSHSSDTPNSSGSYSPSSGSYTPSSVSSYSRPASSYGSSSISPSYDSVKNLDSSIKMSSVSFSDPAMNYGSSSSSPSSNSYSSFKSQPTSVSSSLSNAVESYTPPSAASSSYESGTDSSSSYSNLSSRYLRLQGDRPMSSPYIENDESPGSSSYDTISYSVPMGKY